jgi:hypothetical protein
MPSEPLSADTPLEMEQRQIEAWRRMSDAEKAGLIASLTCAALEMAEAGIRARYPNASERELFLRRAILLHGRELAARAYPDIEALGLE